jgi:hypothetical protein
MEISGVDAVEKRKIPTPVDEPLQNVKIYNARDVRCVIK